VRDLARHFADGRVDARQLRRLGDDEVIAKLIAIKGIGIWSVHMFLLFGLNRPDVLPTGDLGVRKGMQKLYRMRELPAPSQMMRRAAPWRPYRSVASWYMWRAADGAI
jgi:DNA-3-methyladenine glycosylase II